MSRFARAYSRLAAVVAIVVALPAHAGIMRDSTFVESWRLANGLEVRLRHVPGAAGASISMAYRAGALHMPPGHAGLAQLLGELQFTGAAGPVPERTRAELPTLRPAGWDLRQNDHVTVLTELAAPSQLAGVLLQVAARAHGVQVSDSCFRRATSTVRTALAREALGDPNIVLHRRLRDVALGLDDAHMFADAAGKGLDGIDARAATQLLQRLYVPANATLAIAGNLEGFNVREVVEKLFGDIPSGKAEPEVRSARLAAGTRVTQMAGLTEPLAAVAAIAPALDDTLSASYYLAALLAGSHWTDQSGAPRPPLSTSFHYSLLDEPDLVRFYLQPTATNTDTSRVLERWGSTIDGLRTQSFTMNVLDDARASVDWLLGGVVSPPLARLMRRDAAPLRELSASMAIRATWRGDTFWNGWRTRFETTRMSPYRFFSDMLAPGHHVEVLLLPRP